MTSAIDYPDVDSLQLLIYASCLCLHIQVISPLSVSIAYRGLQSITVYVFSRYSHLWKWTGSSNFQAPGDVTESPINIDSSILTFY